MRSKLRGQVGYRVAVMLVASVPLLVATSAEGSVLPPPPNDDIGNATVITGLPFRDTGDISQATWDSSTDVAYCSGSDHSVWYSFTAATSEKVAFDPSASPGIINIDVFTGSPGDLSWIGCGQGGDSGWYNSGFVLNATAGTTYWIMASTLCCHRIPSLDLSVYQGVAPQATLSVNDGTVDRGGNVTVTGTLACVGTVPIAAPMYGGVRQNVGRLSSVSAEFVTRSNCAAAQQWTVLAQPSVGRFTGGPATVNATAYVCNIVGCAVPTTTTVINLRG